MGPILKISPNVRAKFLALEIVQGGVPTGRAGN
jgi:hypothetical protein